MLENCSWFTPTVLRRESKVILCSHQPFKGGKVKLESYNWFTQIISRREMKVRKLGLVHTNRSPSYWRYMASKASSKQMSFAHWMQTSRLVWSRNPLESVLLWNFSSTSYASTRRGKVNTQLNNALSCWPMSGWKGKDAHVAYVPKE